MDLIGDPKKFGIDPLKIADIVTRADTTSKRVDWLSAAAVAIVRQLAARFKFELPPDNS